MANQYRRCNFKNSAWKQKKAKENLNILVGYNTLSWIFQTYIGAKYVNIWYINITVQFINGGLVLCKKIILLWN